MRVLVTGHLGYIGAVLAPMVRDAGHEVVVLDSGLYAGMEVQPLAEITELRKDLKAYTSGKGVTGEELERLINGNVRELPGRFETSSDVLGGIVDIVEHNRPDDYYETLSERYGALKATDLDAEDVARRAMKIAEEICVYTNGNVTVEAIETGA